MQAFHNYYISPDMLPLSGEVAWLIYKGKGARPFPYNTLPEPNPFLLPILSSYVLRGKTYF
jgi:hypothetical protein